mmetsp:Transcript_11423/g.17278  ORF Transcript_11423/g.17278 Transcript_11423/m.17278 type:complete len:655 (+) Transcript_11423:160-2124(+)|eukprot:CAMPEP_0203673778 /NCGR_PEP_ID=MMETSP0090-20130426/13771_1 /ASSEMBLY_ACC=CAM_ASM_001088 /TAXON_ID=426623 /ORGANISM="Chaetoceros affinis, Strain CCMP159" /LENGTH=654 /DNA_ID=CAMNT_0050539499 /DNA_START=126 /DNA_END=2090 /DNA_ORIENTATION=+
MDPDNKAKLLSSDAAHTASLGDHQMMTYMKLPLNVGGSAPSASGGSPSGGDSDVNFLDGLFDPSSGSSDNGSEKGGAADNTDNVNNNAANVASRGPLNHPGALCGRQTSSVADSTKPVASLPLNPLHQHGTLTSAAQMTSSDAAAMTSAAVNGPQHSMQQQQQQTRNGATGTTGDQSNNATRAMSDVSSLTSSSNGNSSPPNIHYQPNEPRPYGVTSTNMVPGQQAQAQAQVMTMNVNQQNTAQHQNQQNNGQYETWMMQGAGTNCTTVGISQTVAFAPNPVVTTQNIAPQPTSAQQTHTQMQLSQPSKTTGKGRGRKRQRDAPQTTASKHDPHASISEDEEDAQKRRRDRNMREQERSQRIANQIGQLKELLAASSIPFKPDKYSTLVSVHGYIKSLQQRNLYVDAEHKKLVETITKTNELVNKAQFGTQAVPNSSSTSVKASGNDGSAQVIPGSNAGPISEEEEELLQYVRGVDYRSVFSRVNIALCVLRIDGRLIDCNDEFVRICSISKDKLFRSGLRRPKPEESTPELIEQCGKHPLSLFNLIANEDMQTIFEAMSRMLTNSHMKDDQQKQNSSGINVENSLSDDIALQRKRLKYDHWTGNIHRCHSSDSQQLNISLVRQKEGTPSFFSCALLPYEKEVDKTTSIKVEST